MDRKDTARTVLTAAIFAVVAPLGIILAGIAVVALGGLVWVAGGNPLF